jgi:hypothetical protein
MVCVLCHKRLLATRSNHRVWIRNSGQTRAMLVCGRARCQDTWRDRLLREGDSYSFETVDAEGERRIWGDLGRRSGA